MAAIGLKSTVGRMDPVLLAHLRQRLGLAVYADGTLAQLDHLVARAHQLLGYDSTPKVLWALTGAVGDPPGMDPTQWWESWCEYGTSGTCYSAGLAFGALLEALGFESTIDGWLLDGGDALAGIDHVTNRVRLPDGTEWVIELSSSVREKLELPAEGRASSDSARGATLSRVGGVTQLHLPWAVAPHLKSMRLMATDVTAVQLLESARRVAALAPASQQRLVVARTRSDGAVVSLFEDKVLLRQGPKVLRNLSATPADCHRLMQTMGFTDTWLDKLSSAGAFDFASRRATSQ